MYLEGHPTRRKRKQSSSIVEEYANDFENDNEIMLCLSVTVLHVLSVLLTCDLWVHCYSICKLAVMFTP